MAPSSHLFTKNMAILFNFKFKKKITYHKFKFWKIENLSLSSLSYLFFLLSSHCQTEFTNFSLFNA